MLKEAKPVKCNLSYQQRRCITNLQKDTSIAVVPADKGRTTVIMNREDYNEKVLADETKY